MVRRREGSKKPTSALHEQKPIDGIGSMPFKYQKGQERSNFKGVWYVKKTNQICALLLTAVTLGAITIVFLETFNISRKEEGKLVALKDISPLQDYNFERDASAKQQLSRNSCSVYFAPSSLPNGGMGLFTIKSLHRGQMIMAPDSPSIPIIDNDNSEESMKAWVKLFRNYWWASGVSDTAKFEAESVIEFQTGMGGLPNSHGYLNNIGFELADNIPYDDSRLNRSTDPMAGAVSYYMGRKTIALHKMNAGEEFFMKYPEGYMKYISRKYNIPNQNDYEEAGKVVNIMRKKYGSRIMAWKEDKGVDLLSKRAISLLPKTQVDLDRIIMSSRRSGSNAALSVAKEMSVKKQNLEWIKERGVCMDNFVPGKSINHQAGHGAIAKRFMMKGDVIAPAPVLQITNRDALRMPAFDPAAKNWQLILNYCLGHEHSSLLLCPITNVVLINHCSERKLRNHSCGKTRKPNAKYRWADWDKASNEWMTKTIADMEKEGGRGLMLEVVATRDIKEGEEVFIDYGKQFEEAWEQHISEWKSPYGYDEKWISAKELNDKLGPLRLAPDFSEKFVSTDDRGIFFTGCFYYEDYESFWDSFLHLKPWRKMSKQDIISIYGNNYYGGAFQIKEEKEHQRGNFWPCVVGAKEMTEGEEDAYIVRILQSKAKAKTAWNEKSLPRIIRHFPRASIRHFYLPYHSDIHLPHVFRHSIGLSDEIFPEIWKDRLPH